MIRSPTRSCPRSAAFKVTTRAKGHIIVRTFTREGTGVVEVLTINVGLTAKADGRGFRFRDVGADVTRITQDGTVVMMIAGQVPFEFAENRR